MGRYLSVFLLSEYIEETKIGYVYYAVISNHNWSDIDNQQGIQSRYLLL